MPTRFCTKQTFSGLHGLFCLPTAPILRTNAYAGLSTTNLPRSDIFFSYHLQKSGACCKIYSKRLGDTPLKEEIWDRTYG